MPIVYTMPPINFPSTYFKSYPSTYFTDPLVNKLMSLFEVTNKDTTDADCLKNAIFLYDTHRLVYDNRPIKLKYAYPSLDNDKKVIKTIVKYYYHKLLDKYIQDNMYDLLGYLKIEGENVEFIKSMNDYKDNIQPSYKDLLKMNFIKKTMLSRRLVYKLLKMFNKKVNGKWYKLGESKIEKYVIKFLHKKLKELFKSQVKG